MSWLSIKVNSKDVEEYLRSRPGAVRREMANAADLMVAAHNSAMLTSFRGYTGDPNNTGKLQRRNGFLKNAMRARYEGDATKIEASSYVAGPLIYARLQELGGEVRPKRRRYLTVPLDAVRTARGVVRKGAFPTRVGGQWMTEQKLPGLKSRETFIKRSANGTPVIYGTGRDGRPVPLWALKKRIRIKPRLGFMRTWDRQEPTRLKILEKASTDMLKGEAPRG